MTTTAFRRIAFGTVPAILLAGALAGCNDSAPSVQAPPSTANTAPATGSGVPTEQSTGQSTEDPVPTDTGVPTVSEAPTTSAATGDPAKVCTTEDDGFMTPGVVGPATKKAAWGKPLDLKQEYEGTVSMTAQKPTTKKPAKDDFFGPKDGQVYLLIKVDVKYKSGEKSSVGDAYFTLRDGKKNECESESTLSEAVPKQEQFDLSTVSKTTPTYSGTLIFDVPPGQDYSKYTLMYRLDNYDNKKPDATLAWTK